MSENNVYRVPIQVSFCRPLSVPNMRRDASTYDDIVYSRVIMKTTKDHESLAGMDDVMGDRAQNRMEEWAKGTSRI
jgi:hypothetical protein